MSEGNYYERFVEHLDKRLRESSRTRAVLRRSLAFPPGTWPEAFPYVEPFMANAPAWTRQVGYLVAGLRALSGNSGGTGNMGAAAFRLKVRADSESTDTRFLALLDSDEEQLLHRLRQMVTLMASHEVAPGWAELFNDLIRWGHPRRFVQEQWAREFYRYVAPDDDKSETEELGLAQRDESALESGEPPARS